MTGPDHLLDRQSVIDVCTNYALALDSRDWSRLKSCFTPDAVADYEGIGLLEGCEAIEGACRRALEPLAVSQHLLGNHLVSVSGDRASSVCYFHAQHVREGVEDGSQLIVAGRYDDEFVRSEGGWRIARRELKVLWTSGNPAVLDSGP